MSDDARIELRLQRPFYRVELLEADEVHNRYIVVAIPPAPMPSFLGDNPKREVERDIQRARETGTVNIETAGLLKAWDHFLRILSEPFAPDEQRRQRVERQFNRVCGWLRGSRDYRSLDAFEEWFVGGPQIHDLIEQRIVERTPEADIYEFYEVVWLLDDVDTYFGAWDHLSYGVIYDPTAREVDE